MASSSLSAIVSIAGLIPPMRLAVNALAIKLLIL